MCNISNRNRYNKIPGMSAMADGTTNTGPEVRSQEDNLRKIILIVAAPMKVAPGRENP
jgi:hypothetical protein